MTVRRARTLLAESWLVLVLSLLFGTALAGVELGLKGRITENKRNETFSQIPSLVPGSDSQRSTEAVIDGRVVFEARDGDGLHVGWVVPAGGQGFADRIEVLVGLDLEATRIQGIFVLDQKETPGLGDFITDEERFRTWFRGQGTDSALTVVKTAPEPGAGRILALTGATISSEAVTDIVNHRVASFRASLAARAGVEGGA